MHLHSIAMININISFSLCNFVCIMVKGKLYLIPSDLGDFKNVYLNEELIQTIHSLRHFIVEQAKPARQFIKKTNPPYQIHELNIMELSPKYRPNNISVYLDPCLEGHSIGLLSDAGCPGIADPGAEIVSIAHRKHIQVIPLIGPSSIFLALMASGLNGQQFCFHGYLDRNAAILKKQLKQLEQESRKNHQTQIFMETPYRNDKMFEALINYLSADTKLCLATSIKTPEEKITTMSILDWKRSKKPAIHKLPTVFLILGE